MRRITYSRLSRLPFSSIRIAMFFSIVVALILIVPIAFASPPDPSWIAGVYDGADGDDIMACDYEPVAGVGVSEQPSLSSPRLSKRFLVSGPSRNVDGVPAIQFTRGPPSSVTRLFCAAASQLQSCARLDPSLHRMRKPQSTRPITPRHLPAIRPDIAPAICGSRDCRSRQGLPAVPLHIGGTPMTRCRSRLSRVPQCCAMTSSARSILPNEEPA